MSGPRYQIGARLGAGGMGEVFLARRVKKGEPDRWVALKRVRSELVRNRAVIARFEHEARILQMLDHPNVVSLVDFGVDRSGPYIALEFVEGRTASSLLRDAPGGQLPIEAVISIALDAARGLAYAHSGAAGAAVIHRDVSLDNVLVSNQGVALLTDLGIAKVSGYTELTATGSLKGKFGYMAPEIFEGRPPSPAIDVFAFGVSVYRLLCGVSPFVGTTDAGLMRAVLSATPPRTAELRADTPPALDELLQACLSKSPDLRPAMDEAVARLQPLARSDGERRAAVATLILAAPAEPTPHTVDGALSTAPFFAPRSSRVRGFWPLLIALVLLGGGAGTWRLHGSREAARKATTPVASAPPPPAAPPPEAPKLDPPELKVQGPPPETPAPVIARPNARAQRPATGRGRLKIKVSPWGYVFVDGKLIGTTPLEPISLEKGDYSVLVVNSELGAKRTFRVTIKPGLEKQLDVVLSR